MASLIDRDCLHPGQWKLIQDPGSFIYPINVTFSPLAIVMLETLHSHDEECSAHLHALHLGLDASPWPLLQQLAAVASLMGANESSSL